MKLSIMLFATLFFSMGFAKAQINAITETGDEVILYEDGTWAYLYDSILEASTIFINEKKFKKSKNATFLVKSSKAKVGVYINPKEWTFEKGDGTDPQEYTFTMKNGDLAAMLISEKVEIPIQTLRGIALANAKNASSDIKVIHEEYRTVNDNKMLMMQMTGTIQGIKFVYFGYYFSSETGTVQFLTYTYHNLFEGYKDQCEDFLNGLVVIE